MPKPGKIEGKNVSDEQLTPFFTETDIVTLLKVQIKRSLCIVRYTTDFLKSNIVVVDGSTNDQEDIQQHTEVLPLPWISLNIRNGDLFVPTIHHSTP